jgi:NitT/TauT family transport system substrate-binding protein
MRQSIGTAAAAAMRVACLAALCWVCAMLPAAADTEVRIGTLGSSSDAGFYIADHKGYFAAEGIKAVFVKFDSAAKMIAPLGTGQLDVGGGAPSSALYNAVSRGIGIKIIADKGVTSAGHGYQPLLVRKDLVDGGRFKDFKDLKGMKIANVAVGVSTSVTLADLLKRGNLSEADVEVVNLAYPQHVVALHNKAIDAALTIEPMATIAVNNGDAVRFIGDDEIYPNHQLAVVLFSGDFAAKSPDLARRFARAYVKAQRDYNDALVGGKLAGPKADDIIAILTAETSVKDPQVYRSIVMHGANPDGRVNLQSLQKDLDYFRAEKLVDGPVALDQVVDGSFVDAAVQDLGPYIPKPR